MRLHQWLITFIPVLVRFPPKSGPERDSGVQAGYRGGGPRRHDEVERWGREGRKTHRRCVIGGWVWTTVGNWGVALVRPLQEYTCQSGPTEDIFTHELLSLLGAWAALHSSKTCSTGPKKPPGRDTGARRRTWCAQGLPTKAACNIQPRGDALGLTCPKKWADTASSHRKQQFLRNLFLVTRLVGSKAGTHLGSF